MRSVAFERLTHTTALAIVAPKAKIGIFEEASFTSALTVDLNTDNQVFFTEKAGYNNGEHRFLSHTSNIKRVYGEDFQDSSIRNLTKLFNPS